MGKSGWRVSVLVPPDMLMWQPLLKMLQSSLTTLWYLVRRCRRLLVWQLLKIQILLRRLAKTSHHVPECIGVVTSEYWITSRDSFNRISPLTSKNKRTISTYLKNIKNLNLKNPRGFRYFWQLTKVLLLLLNLIILQIAHLLHTPEVVATATWKHRCCLTFSMLNKHPKITVRKIMFQ